MIKDALKYVVGLNAPFITEINGRKYSDKALDRVESEHYAKYITLSTLSSLVEYIKSGVDTMKGNMIVHVESSTQVNLFSNLDDDRQRECVVQVKAKLPYVDVNKYIDRESFNIALQSKFVRNEDRDILLKFVGTVENGTVQQYGDDGVSQKATIKTGIASKGDAIVPNPVTLKPYRTFTEVEQPESAFVFRMREGRAGEVECAIFEADGGAWEIKAMETVKAYLKEALQDIDGYIIIS